MTKESLAAFKSDYNKIFNWDEYGIVYGKTSVMACDLNNCNAYTNIVERSGTLIALDRPEFIKMMVDECDIRKMCGENVPNVLVCDTLNKLNFAYEAHPINTIIFYPISGKVYNCIKAFIEEEKDIMKFDMVITNPPYDGDLHLQILDELKNISNKVICVHPARWVEDILAQYKGKNATGRKYEHLKKMLTKVMMIKQKDGCEMFNIELRQDMMIGVYENGNENTGVLSIYNDSNMFFGVLEKILNYSHTVKSLGDMDEENKIDGIRVEIKEMMPRSGASTTMTELARHYPVCVAGKDIFVDGVGEDGKWWSISGKQKCGWTKDEGTPIPHSIKFNTKKNAQTFIDLYRTNVVKNIIHMLKYDQNAGHTHIPYFDPKTIKTEDEVLDAFGITNEEYRKWLKREVYDYREKDFIKYGEWIDCQ